jgi:hypothetical protein
MTDQPGEPGPEERRLFDRLFNTPGKRLLNINIFRGDGPATREDICRAMNSAMDQVKDGTAIVSTTFRDDRPQVNVRDYLAKLVSEAP